VTATEYLLDAGPLIALLDRGDRHHSWALQTVDELRAPLLTCEPVLSEAWFLARRGGADPTRVVDLVERLPVRVLPAWGPSAVTFLRKYADRCSVADAALLALAEADAARVVVTTDVEDFSVYRIGERRVVPALMPLA